MTSTDPLPTDDGGVRRALRYGATLPIAVIDPLTRSWNEASSLVFSRPIAVDAHGEIRGDLVRDWEVSDDGLQYRLRARAGVTWHDGEPFSAADLAFTLGLMADPALVGNLKPALPSVAAVAVDGDVVVLTFARPVPGVVGLLTKACVLPAHRHDRGSLLAGGLDDEPIGTGPYRVVERGDGVATFAAHETYHGGAPTIARIEMCHIAQDADRAAAAAEGSIDLAQVKPQHLDQLAGRPSVTVHTIGTRVWRALTFGLGRPHLSDPRVRRALSMAIDRDRVVAEALGGYGLPQYWPVPPTSWASPPEPPTLGEQPADALLREVGWDRDGDGRWIADGAPVAFTFCYLETETFRTAASVELQRQFGDFGIELTLEPITWQQYQEMDRVGLSGSRYDGIVVGWSGGVDPYDNLASRYSTTGAYNRDGYSDPELDTLLDEAAAAPDRSTAIDRYRAALDITHRDSIMAPLVNAHYVFAAATDLTGFEDFEVDSFYEFPQFAHLIRWIA